MGMTSEDLPSTMPAETPQIGDTSRFAAARKAIESVGSSGQEQPSPGGAPPGGPQPTPQAPPVQPPPRQPLTPADVQPGGPIFSQTKQVPKWGFRRDIRIAAAHPDSGPWTGALLRKLDDEERQTGKQTTPQ